MKLLFSISFILFFWQNSVAQNVFSDLKSLEKRADKHFADMSYMSAIDLYGQLLAKPKNVNNNKVRLKLARAFLKVRQTELAEVTYREAILRGLKLRNSDSIQFAGILISNNNYEEAKLWMPSSQNNNGVIVSSILYKSIADRHAFYRDSFSFSVKPIIYNSEYSDFSPVYYKGDVVFSSDRPSLKLIKQINMQKDAGFSEMYFFREKDTIQRPAEPMKIDYKSPLHKGPAIFYDNGNKMIVTLNSRKGSVSRLQLYTAEWDKRKSIWTNFQPFQHNNDFYSVGHPALSKDERTLYFVSDLPGGNGGTDLYVSVLKDGEWSSPKNMREPINTEGNEMFPYISPSGSLYFSSNGHGGLGGLDIFYVSNTNLTIPEIFNPGYPLNSSGDDFSLILDNQEKSGYFSSDRIGGKGDDDIYKLYIKKVDLKLKVLDEITGASSLDPIVKVIDKDSGEEILVTQVSKKENRYDYSLKLHHYYKLLVEKEDYKSFEKDISTMAIEDNQLVELKVVLKRKFEYYVTLKIRDAETENIVENCSVKIINLSSQEFDSIAQKKSEEIDIKLDVESDYLIVASDEKRVGYIFIEKKSKKKVSSVSFQTLTITKEENKKMNYQLFDTTETNLSKPIPIVVKDMITGEQQTIFSKENGELEFFLRSNCYYRLYYDRNQFYYDSLKKLSTGNMIFKEKK